MTRRPIKRVPVVEQCPKCGQHSRPDGPLCRRCYGRDRLRQDLARPFPSLPMTREEERQAREAASFDSSVITHHVPLQSCSHGYEDWSDCPACTNTADFDDGGGE
jgi:hypothetical protein